GAPHEGSTDARDLVGRDLLTVARTAEDDAERLDTRLLVPCDGPGRVDAERGVVVERVIVTRTMVDDLMPLLDEVLLQVATEVEAGVIGGDVDAHQSSLGAVRTPIAQSNWGPRVRERLSSKKPS